MAQIRKALDWIGRAFDIRGPRRSPVEIQDQYRATFDAFGTHRLAEMESADFSAIQGLIPAGDLEAIHDQVATGRWRFYFSMTFQHDNPIAQILAPAVIVPSGGAFLINRFLTEVGPAQGVQVSVRWIQVGPQQRLALEGRLIPTATTISARVSWIEMPLGESFSPL